MSIELVMLSNANDDGITISITYRLLYFLSCPILFVAVDFFSNLGFSQGLHLSLVSF